MVAQPKTPTFTVAEYLAMEDASDTKHEYLDGYIYAMAGGTPDHATLGAQVVTELVVALRGNPRRVYDSDVRVQLSPTRYVYPDAAVSCDERDRRGGQDKEIHYPCLIAEALSDSTAANDRGDKFAAYRAVETIQDYLLINQHRIEVEHYHRRADDTDDDAWDYRAHGPGDRIAIDNLSITISVDNIYDKIDL